MRADPERLSKLQRVACEIHELIPDVDWTFGKAASKEHGSPRRYNWVRTRSPAVPSEQAGPQALEFCEGELASSTWTLTQRVMVDVYGETDGALAQMVDNFIAAGVNAIGPSFRLELVDWELPTDGLTQRNQMARIIFGVAIPTVDRTQKLRVVTGYADVCGTLQDDGTVKPQD